MNGGGGGTVDTSSLITTSSFNTYTASINTYTSSINTYTSSINSYTSSINTRTGSFTLTSSFAAYTASINGWTGSVVTTSSFNAYTGSVTTTASFNALTSSFVSFSSSINSFTSSINTYTASINAKTSSFATTGSNNFNGDQSITGSLTVSLISTISSSIATNASSLTLTSGSNLYIQNNGLASITGSLIVSGSTSITGAISVTDVITGNITNAQTASYVQNAVSASYWSGSIVNAATASSVTPLNQNVVITGSLLQSGSITITSGSITMPNRPGFRVTGAGGGKTATTVLSGSYLNVDWQQGSGWDNSTGTFTAPIAGLYQVNLVVRINSNTLGTISQLIVFKNNTSGTNGTQQIMVEFGVSSSMNHAGGSTISKLAAGDTLKMVVAAGEISFDANDNFSVAYIG